PLTRQGEGRSVLAGRARSIEVPGGRERRSRSGLARLACGCASHCGPGPPHRPWEHRSVLNGRSRSIKVPGGASAAPVERWLVSPPAAPHTAAPGPPTGPGSVGPFSIGARGTVWRRSWGLVLGAFESSQVAQLKPDDDEED